MASPSRCSSVDYRRKMISWPAILNSSEYIKTLSLDRQPEHELGFSVPDSVYFSETRPYVAIPDFLLTPTFLRAVSRYETLPQAKAILQELNAHRSVDDRLLFFSYESRHLGTPDTPESFRRLLIVVPGKCGAALLRRSGSNLACLIRARARRCETFRSFRSCLAAKAPPMPTSKIISEPFAGTDRSRSRDVGTLGKATTTVRCVTRAASCRSFRCRQREPRRARRWCRQSTSASSNPQQTLF